MDLGPQRPAEILSNDTGSGFFNYALRLEDFRHASALTEAGAAYKNGLAYTQVNVGSDGRVVRGLSNLSYALPERMERLVLGDAFASTGTLGGGVLVGGASYFRDFNLDPYFLRYPSSGLSGAVATASTVEVYVNGVLVRRQDVAPGTFDVSNIPLMVGAGTTRVVVRDAYGREQVVAAPFYFSEGILKPGVSDFAFSAGFQRNNLGLRSWDYDPAVFLGRYRIGLTGFLTPGARIEGKNGLLSGGGDATVRTLFGDAEAAVAGSFHQYTTETDTETTRSTWGGAAGWLSFTHLERAFTAGALLRAYSDHYVTLAMSDAQDRARGQADLFAGAAMGPRLSLTLRGGLARYRDAGDASQVGLLANVKAHQLANVFVTATRTTAATMSRASYEVYAVVSVVLPDRMTAAAYYDQKDSQGAAGADLQRSMGLGPDYGYRVHAGFGATTDLLAIGQAQSAYGRYEASVERSGGQTRSVLSASGALVTLGGGLFATRPVQQGYGLIQVPGVEGVRGRLNNQDIGRTNSDGNLLVPQMIPYYANRLSIADEDLPMDYKIGRTEYLVAPPLQGGSIARFEVEKLRVVTGSVVMNVGGTDVDPSFGQLLVHVGQGGNGERSSPLGKHGEFYLENVPAGRYPAELDSSVGSCRFELNVPGGDAFIDAGRTKCLGRVPAGMAPPGTVEPLPSASPATTPPPAAAPEGKKR